MPHTSPRAAKDWLNTYGPPSMANLLLGIIIMDTRGVCRYANKRALELLQTNWAKIRGKRLHDVVCSAPGKPSNHEPERCIFIRPLKTGRVRLRRIQTMYSLSGQPFWVEYSTSPIREGKKIAACLISFADASRLQRTKHEFTESQALFKAMFDAHSDSLFIIDESNKILQANPTAVAMFGAIAYGKAKLFSHLQFADAQKVDRWFTQASKRRKPQIRTQQITVDRSAKYFETTVYTHFVKKRHLVIFRDVTAQIRDQLKKERMMAIAGHELRTPIAVIKSFTQLVKRKLADRIETKYLGYLDRIENKATVLQRLLNNIIDEVKAGENKLTFLDEPVDIDELVAEVVQDMRMVARKHTLQLQGSSATTLRIDKSRLTQVLSNIITNAIKYSPESDVIRVDIKRTEQHVHVSVTDFGIGIPAQSQKHIFEAFYRSTKHKNAEFPGLGLGLYLSNKIVSYYGGSITFTSKNTVGTTFTISLPVHS